MVQRKGIGNRVLALVLASGSWYNGTNAPFVSSLMVDKEMMRLGHWLASDICRIQCFDTVGWVSGRASDL